jgi:hypothetical protein
MVTFREILGVMSTWPVTTAFTLQDPDSQVAKAPHLCPQVPQLDSSVFRLVQPPPQQVAVSPEQMFPQEPQLPLFVERFTQVPSQFVIPLMKHAFDKPIPPRVKVVPGEVVVAVEVVVVVTAAVVVTGTAVVVSVGTFEQVEALQIMPAGHWFPQIPQLLALDVSS